MPKTNVVFVLTETVKESRVKKSVEVLENGFPLIMYVLNAEINGLKIGDGNRQIGNSSWSNVKNVERQGNK